MQLRPGDRLVFYTDGITEAHNAQGELFGVERLDEVFAACPTCPASELVQGVLDALQRFTGGTTSSDDRTLLIAAVS